MKKKLLLVALSMAAFPSAFAEDIRTTDGKFYRNADVIRSDPEGIFLSTSDGIIQVPFEVLSTQIKKRFGYDPEKAAKFAAAKDSAAEMRIASETAKSVAGKLADDAATTAADRQAAALTAAAGRRPPASVAPARVAAPQIAPTPELASGGVVTDISADEAQSIKGYEVGDLMHQGMRMDGRLVRVKFSARSSSMSKGPDGSMTGDVTNSSASQFQELNYVDQGGYAKKDGSVPVTIPKAGLDYFMKIQPSSGPSAREIVLYGRVKVSKNSFTVILLGREIATDRMGSHIKW